MKNEKDKNIEDCNYVLYLCVGGRLDQGLISFRTIKEMDSFTMNFVGKNDLLNYYGYRDTDYDLVIYGNHTGKSELIMYNSDRYDCAAIQSMYYNFLMGNRECIDDSLLKYVNKGVVVNKNMSNKDFDRVFRAFYRENPYKKFRDTYFELVDFQVIERTFDERIVQKSISEQSSGIKPYVDNTFLNECINRDNYDELLKYCDLDDMPVEVMEHATGSKGRR